MKRLLFNLLVGFIVAAVLYFVVYRDLKFYYAFSNAALVEAKVSGPPEEIHWNPFERDKSLSHQQTRQSYSYPLELDTTGANGQKVEARAELVGRTFTVGERILVYYTDKYPDYVIVRPVRNFQLKRASLEGWLVLLLMLLLAFSYYNYQWRLWKHRRYVENICVDIQRQELSAFELAQVPELQRPYVRRVNLSHNNLEKLPLNLDQLHQVRILNLSHNRFEKLPVVIEKFKHLEKLDLSHNPLERIDIRWKDLKNLKEVDLRGCPLEAIPPSLKHLPHLEVLHLPDHLA